MNRIFRDYGKTTLILWVAFILHLIVLHITVDKVSYNNSIKLFFIGSIINLVYPFIMILIKVIKQLNKTTNK